MFQATIKSQYKEDISILVQPKNHKHTYLCECGEASTLTVKEVQNCKAVFISHTHIDHFVNFDTILRHQIGLQERIVLVGPQGLAQQVQSRLNSYTWNLIEEGAIIYEVRELVSDNELHSYELAPPLWNIEYLGTQEDNLLYEEKTFEVRGVLLDHKIPTLAYRFNERDRININLKDSGFIGGPWINELKLAFEQNQLDQIIQVGAEYFEAHALFHLLQRQKGHSLGIIMDHAAHEDNHQKIEQHFKYCQTVYIESFYKEEDKELADINYHSYTKASALVMHKSKIVEAIPVHFSRKYNKEDIEALSREFETAFLEN